SPRHRDLLSFPTRRSSDLKTSFWARLFGSKPKRPPLDKRQAQELSADLRKQLVVLRDLLFSEDDTQIETIVGSKALESENDSMRSEEHTSELQSRENLVCR